MYTYNILSLGWPGGEAFVSVQVRVLGIFLVVSLLLNVAGLVFFISFLNLSGHYRAVKRERNQMEHILNVIKSAAMMPGESPGSQVYRRSFISEVDGEPDCFGVIPPGSSASYKDLTLVVYLHGMGSSYVEPFVGPVEEPVAEAVTAKVPSIVFLSVSYRKQASWGSDNALADISQNIREVSAQFPVRHIVMMGTSMGGCISLTYAEQAPPDIKGKICGIVSVESAGDLSSLYDTSENIAVREALVAAFGGTPAQASDAYRRRSFLGNLDLLSPKTAVAVVSARSDSIVPPQLQKNIAEELGKRNVPVKLIEVDGGHRMPAAQVYLEALDFVMPRKEAAYAH